jgi:hypothetical protein
MYVTQMHTVSGLRLRQKDDPSSIQSARAPRRISHRDETPGNEVGLFKNDSMKKRPKAQYAPRSLSQNDVMGGQTLQ